MFGFIRVLIFLLLISICSFSCQNLPRREWSPLDPDLAPIPAQAHFYKALIEEDQENWQVACTHLEKAARRDPKAARIHLHLGKCLLHLKKYRRGIQALQTASLYAASNDYLFWFELGEIYHSIHIVAMAKKYYQRSIAIFPEFQKALQALATLEGKTLENHWQIGRSQ